MAADTEGSRWENKVPASAVTVGEGGAAQPLSEFLDGLGGGGGGAVAWSDIADKPAVIAEGATQADARTAIGAGTGNGSSNLAVGSTVGAALASAAGAGASTQAARADHVHPFPTAANVGAAAASHAHTATQVTATAIGPGTATTVQGILAELAARITALETP